MVGVVLVLSAANLNAYYGTAIKGQARDVMSYIDGNARSGDLVFVYSGGANAMIFIWYNNKTDLTNKGFPAKYIDLWSKSTDQNINELNSDVAGHDRVWIASTQQHEYIVDLVKASMQKTLNASYDTTYSKSCLDYNVHLYEKRA